MWVSKGIVAVVAVAVAAAGCTDAGGVDVLSYEEFKAQAYREPVTGTFVVNGDERVITEAGLREVYDAYLDSVAREGDPGYGTVEQGLIVNRYGGQDDIWSAADALNLRYCVDLVGWGLSYATVVQAMNSAAASWEAIIGARVNFIHDVTKDALCNASTTGVTFDVRRVTGTDFYAAAFYPSFPRQYRTLLIDSESIGNISPFTLAGILRHELGHVLGFKHEHTRPEAGTCFEDNNWRSVTPYDSASVMHYPSCNGTQTGDLKITELDIQGARALYP
jgi:hypothetical protein